ncbi:hypothetical protein [uncultured Aliiroseovarius sp.]|uniref:hypothetical protein n=1 Tax=uncultured Aliiroseovarius sp. TaxID=1658783 RepID=UPI00262E53F0|nr:hypothetical protein [uncultured Aliiroseovarius sp.]
MDFDKLQELLSNWYEVPPTELAAPESAVPQGLNPILEDFYQRFGALTLRKSQFANPDSNFSPLSCQDQVVPLDELNSQDGYTIFSVENQGVFVVAASNDPSDPSTYAKGDAVFDEELKDFAGVGISLQESLITCVLRETIMSVGDRYRRITPDKLKMDLLAAQAGDTVVSRYIWRDSYYTFHLSKDVWFMDWDGMQFSAHRGLWRQGRSTWQEQVFENGGGWSSGPSKPTMLQKVERFLTGLRK